MVGAAADSSSSRPNGFTALIQYGVLIRVLMFVAGKCHNLSSSFSAWDMCSFGRAQLWAISRRGGPKRAVIS